MEIGYIHISIYYSSNEAAFISSAFEYWNINTVSSKSNLDEARDWPTANKIDFVYLWVTRAKHAIWYIYVNYLIACICSSWLKVIAHLVRNYRLKVFAH